MIQSLKAETRLPILPVKPQGDKVSRAHAVSPLVESGRVYLPEKAGWLDDFILEATSFPSAPHDDQVDAMSQGLSYLRGDGPRSYESRFWRGGSMSVVPGLGRQAALDLAEDRAADAARLYRQHSLRKTWLPRDAHFRVLA